MAVKQPLAAAIAALLAGGVHAAGVEEMTIIGDPADAQDIAGSAFVVTAEELEQFTFTDVHKIARLVPGVYLREEEGYGLRPNIGIRGSGSGRSSKITLMEDGVLAAPAPYSNPAAYYFPTTGRMSGVEVLKGPQTLLYGPFTVGGAVNLLSTPIPEQAGGFAEIEAGNYGEQRAHVGYGARNGQWRYLVEAHLHETDGFHDIDRSKSATGFDKEDYVIKLGWAQNPDSGLGSDIALKLNYAEETSNVSYLGLSDADFAAEPTRRYGLTEKDQMENHHAGIMLRYRYGFSEDLALTATAYRNNFSRNWYKLDKIDGDSPGTVIGNANDGDLVAQAILDGDQDVTDVDLKNNNREYVSQGVQLELTGDWQTGGVNHEWVLGARSHDDEMDRYQPVDTFDQVNGSLVYQSTALPTGSNNRFETGEALTFWAMDQMALGDWAITAGLRYEDIETERTQYGDPARATVASQRSNQTDVWLAGLGATYDLNPRWQLLAGVHQGFAPAGGGAKEGTDPEESVNWEGGFRYLGERVRADVIAFYSDYQNTVVNCSVANPCTGGRDFGTESLGEAEVQGLEVALATTLFEANGMRAPLQLSYTYSDGEITETADDGSVLAGDVLPDLPEQQFSLKLGVERENSWSAHLLASYIDSMCVDNSCDRAGVDARYKRTDDYLVVDAVASMPLTTGAEVYAKVENLFDEQAIVARSPYGARVNEPLTGLVGVRLSF